MPVWPVPSNKITQGFGGSHRAVDISVPAGTPVVSPTGGVVKRAGWDTSGYGNLVVLQSGNQTIYLAHLSDIAVRPGQSVKPGQIIGYSGSTGRSTGPHLHYEIRQDGGWINPLELYKDIKLAAGQATYKVAKAVVPGVVGVTAGTVLSQSPVVYGIMSVKPKSPPNNHKSQPDQSAQPSGAKLFEYWAPERFLHNAIIGFIGLVMIIIGIIRVTQPYHEDIAKVAKVAIKMI